MVPDLLRFTQRSAFQRAALRAVAMQLATQELEPSWRHFSALDPGCGLITVAHLEELLRSVPEPDVLRKVGHLEKLGPARQELLRVRTKLGGSATRFGLKDAGRGAGDLRTHLDAKRYALGNRGGP